MKTTFSNFYFPRNYFLLLGKLAEMFRYVNLLTLSFFTENITNTSFFHCETKNTVRFGMAQKRDFPNLNDAVKMLTNPSHDFFSILRKKSIAGR
jgi:hypothetical protein